MQGATAAKEPRALRKPEALILPMAPRTSKAPQEFDALMAPEAPTALRVPRAPKALRECEAHRTARALSAPTALRVPKMLKPPGTLGALNGIKNTWETMALRVHKST